MGDNDNKDLDAIFWRDEILQVMYWLRGEELREVVTAPDLEVFLSASASDIHFHLERAVEEGYVERHPDGMGLWQNTRYALAERGVKEGGRRFRDEFNDMQKGGHGECGPDCVHCKDGNYHLCAAHQKHEH